MIKKFLNKVKSTFFTRQFLLFGLCGTISSFLNMFISLALSLYIDSTLAYVAGYIITVFVNYVLVTYMIYKLPIDALRLFKYTISYIPSLLILIVFVAVLLNVFGLPEFLVYLAAAGVGFPLTFIIVRLYAFGSKEPR